MAALSPAKAAMLVGTGALMVIFGSGNFALLYIIQGQKYNDDEKNGVFGRYAAFWTAIPVAAVGLLGVLAGITKKNMWVSLYMIGSAVATALSMLVAIVIGIRVSSIRVACGEDTECKNSDKAVLMGTIVLLSSILVTIALWACVKACQSKWGPAKNTSSLHVVGELRTANGLTPPPTVVIQPESHPQPPGEENAVAGTSRQESSPSPQSSGYESAQRVEQHEYVDVTPKPTNKIDDSPRYEDVNPRGDERVSHDTFPKGEGTGDEDTGYEAVIPAKEHKYEKAEDVPDKTSMEKTNGDDSPVVVEVHCDPIQDGRHGNTHDNKAFENDELTTAL